MKLRLQIPPEKKPSSLPYVNQTQKEKKRKESCLCELDSHHLYVHESYVLSPTDGGMKHLGGNVGLPDHSTEICVASSMS